MIKSFMALCGAMIFSACASLPFSGPTGTIQGKAVIEGRRLAGAKITATAEMGVPGREVSYSALSGDGGEFSLSVPPGVYFLTLAADGGIHGFFGGNPVVAAEGKVSALVLQAGRWTGKTVYEPNAVTGIGGTVHSGSGYIPDAGVSIFLDASSRFRGPGYAHAITDADGRFFVPLEAGSYYVVIRRRRGGEQIGPLRQGDGYSFYPGNPVRLREGQAARLEVDLMEVAKEPSMVLAETSQGVLISGQVMLKEAGLPGVRVCLYAGPEPMGMPAFISAATDADGRFEIRVTRPGIYYMAARRQVGQALAPGEYVAFYKGPEGGRVIVNAGRNITGLTINWEEEP